MSNVITLIKNNHKYTMQENTLIPSDAESDDDILADLIEKQYLPKVPPTTPSMDTGTTGINTRATQKRTAHYPIQEPPPAKRRGNPTRSQAEVLASIEECAEREKAILANQEVLKTNQAQILERLERMTKMIIDCQTRMSVAEARIHGLQEARREASTGTATTSRVEARSDTTPHVDAGTSVATSRGVGMF